MLDDRLVWGWDPLAELRRLQRDVDRAIGGAGAVDEPFPALNIYSTSEEVLLTAEVPGIDPKELSISVNGNRLSLEGERQAEEINQQVVCHRRERGTGSFARTVLLPFNVESDKVTASYRNGVLSVKLPREETAKPRKIAIAAG